MNQQELRATEAARNAQIVERIRAGEKRSSLATEYGLNIHTISRISIKAGLPKWSRPGRAI